MTRIFRHALFIAAVLCANARADVSMISYFGGSGDDEVKGAAFMSNGDIVIGGTSTSSSIAATQGTKLADGNGFVARLDREGTAVKWLVRLASVKKVETGPQDAVYVMLDKSVSVLASDGSKFVREGSDLGATTVTMDAAADGSIAVLAGGNAIFLKPDGTEKWRKAVGRSHPLSLAIDPATMDVWVGGDKNTNTGYEPWRSPFLFQYAASNGERKTVLWDWPGPAVRADGKQLQADSFIRFLQFSADGRLWVGAGSDGGNTVLTKKPDNLDQAQDALSGSCFSGPCFGYKGAKKTGKFGRMNASITDFERASWVVPYGGMDPGAHLDPPCGCKGGNFQGTGVNPGSFAVSAMLPIADSVIILGNPWGKGPATKDGWFYNTVYPGGGIGWMAVFSNDLKQITQASMIPGTRNAIGAYRGGRLLVAGKAADFSGATIDPAEKDWHVSLPASQGAIQKQYAGGKSDGYFILACMTNVQECNSTNAVHAPPMCGKKSMHAPVLTTEGLLLGNEPAIGAYSLVTVSGRIIQSGIIPFNRRISLKGNYAHKLHILQISGSDRTWTWKIVGRD